MIDLDTVLKLAREVGAYWEYNRSHPVPCVFRDDEMLMQFADLIAKHEREKVAKWLITHGYATGHGDTIEDLLGELEWQVREREREACAKVCDAEAEATEADGAWLWEARRCAAAIRSRT